MVIKTAKKPALGRPRKSTTEAKPKKAPPKPAPKAKPRVKAPSVGESLKAAGKGILDALSGGEAEGSKKKTPAKGKTVARSEPKKKTVAVSGGSCEQLHTKLR